MEAHPTLPSSHVDAAADEHVFWCPVARRYRTTEQTTPPALPQGGRRHISEFLGSQVPPRDPALPAAAVVVPIQKRDDRRRGRGQRARLHIADFMRLQNMTGTSSTASSTPQSQTLPPAALPPHSGEGRSLPPAALPPHSIGEGSSIPSLGSPLPSSRHPACSPSVRSGSGPPLPPHLQATPRGCGDAWAREVAARSASMSSDGSARPVYPWGHGGQPYTPLQRNRQQAVGPTTELGAASVGYTQSCTASDDAQSCRSGALRSSEPPAEVPPSPHTFAVSPLALQPVPSPQPHRLQVSPSCPPTKVFQHNPYADPPTPDAGAELPPAVCSNASASLPPATPVSEVRSMRAVSEVTSVPSVGALKVSSTPTVATAQFKYGRQGEFHVPPGVVVQVGEHAIVEGDRGEDLGMIVATRMTAAADRADPLVLSLLRQATEEESLWWRNGLAEMEREAAQEAQSVIEKYSVSMKIVHAEWQFDRKKLTFHFSSREAQPDFRHLLGECHSIWKCRIWFAKYVKPGTEDRVNLADTV